MSKQEWKITGSWLPRRLEVIQSPAWQNAPRALKSIIEELEVEHMRHRGRNNGHLLRSYTQFVQSGFNRTTVSRMTKLGEALGLLKINRESGIGRADLRDALEFTLTFLPTGTCREVAPTDDWKRIKSEESAVAIVNKFKAETVKKSVRNLKVASL